MNTRNANPVVRSHTAGFSLIEVMVAAVVLATGLMALAALQASLIRGAADSRSRSQVAAFVELVTERQRAVGATGFTAVPSSTAWTSAELAAVQTSAGVSNLAVAVTSTLYDGRSGTFVVCDSTCAGTLAPAAPQYKEIRTVATWTDSSGTARRYDMTSTVSPRTVADSTTPLNSPTGGNSATAKPVVRTNIPSDPGIIPIAIGANTDTAATNPKPKVSGGQVVRTSFEVLTYRTEASAAIQQQRVETAVIGCKCVAGTAPSASNAQFGTARWPAYWNGTRYVLYTPADNTNPPGTAASTGKATGVVQDELCVECCRDHHDASTGSHVKFDPFRTPHTHFKRTGGVLATAAGNEVYEESCRMLRVDGFWRTAADVNSDYFNFLATANSAADYVPDSGAQTNYQNMVKGYLNQRFTTGTAYNTPLGSTDVAALESTHSINNPTNISIERVGGQKWLHTRGVYIDHLEADALAAIAAAKAKTSCAGTAMPGCVLPLVPFTTINLTELAEYTSGSTVQITAENNGFSTSTLSASGSQPPVRGRVRSGSNPAANTPTNVTVNMTKSNSGLAVINPIDTADQTTQQDVQLFTTTGSGPADGTGGTFSVTLNPYTFLTGSTANYPKVAFTNSGGSDITCNRATEGSVIPNPYSCEASRLSIATSLKVTEYNYESPTRVAYAGVVASCKSNSVTLSCTFSGSDRRQCQNWNVTSPSTGTSESGSGKFESTVISYTSIVPGESITIGFAVDSENPTTVGSTDGIHYTCSLPNGANRTCDDATLTWKDPCL